MSFILIVDANKTLAARASDVLIAGGHACGWVTSAEQAVTLLRWRAPDLVLLDQSIPGADGGMLSETLRRAANSPDLPIILLANDIRDAAPDNTVLDYISKPFDPRFLVWRVNHALEAHSGHPLTVDGDDGWPPRPSGDSAVARSFV